MATTLVPQQPDVPPPVHLQGGAYVDESQMADVEKHDPPASHVLQLHLVVVPLRLIPPLPFVV